MKTKKILKNIIPTKDIFKKIEDSKIKPGDPNYEESQRISKAMSNSNHMSYEELNEKVARDRKMAALNTKLSRETYFG